MLVRRHFGPRGARWPFDPLAGFDESARAFDPIRRLFGDLDREFAAARLDRTRAVLPRIDLADDGEVLRLSVELPGFTEKDGMSTLRPFTVKCPCRTSCRACGRDVANPSR